MLSHKCAKNNPIRLVSVAQRCLFSAPKDRCFKSVRFASFRFKNFVSASEDHPPRCSSARTPYLAQAGRSCVRGAPGLHGALGILLLPPTERAAFSTYSSRGPLPPQPRTPMASALAAARPTGQLKSPSAPLRLSGFFRKRQGGVSASTPHALRPRLGASGSVLLRLTVQERSGAETHIQEEPLLPHRQPKKERKKKKTRKGAEPGAPRTLNV